MTFNLGIVYNSKSINDIEGANRGDNRKIVEVAMEYKRIDEIKNKKKLLKEKIRMRKTAIEILGEKCNKYKRLMKHLNTITKHLRRELRTKYDKKINHLRTKYQKDREGEIDMIPEEIEEFGGAAVFNKERFDRIEIEEIQVVKYGDEEWERKVTSTEEQ